MEHAPATPTYDVDLLLPEELAERLRVSRYVIMKYARDGVLRVATRNFKGTPRFKWEDALADIDRYHEERAK